MANMDYCKFENTLADLRQCYNGMMDTDDAGNNASDSEQRARESLLLLCKRIVDDYEGEIKGILRKRELARFNVSRRVTE